MMNKLTKTIIYLSSLIICLVLMGCPGGGGGGGGGDSSLTRVPNTTVSGCFVENYPDPATSPYVLPYQIGMSFNVNNGNCGRSTTHRPNCTAITAGGSIIRCGDARYAFDFFMPVGIVITAAREGIVTVVVDEFSNDTNGAGQENQVSIQHDDGTVATYLHFSPDSIFVSVGDFVSKGDPIGLAGSSGFTDPPNQSNPHLHLIVYRPPFTNCTRFDASGCVSVPFTFSNANPPDKPLIQGTTYEALPF